MYYLSYPCRTLAAPFLACMNNSDCDPTNGRCDVSTYTCMCNPGYHLGTDNSTCLGIVLYYLIIDGDKNHIIVLLLGLISILILIGNCFIYKKL